LNKNFQLAWIITGFSWERVHFLSGSWGSAVFRIWDENDADNILMFLIVAGHSRTFQPLTLAWAARCMGSWGGNTARTADPNWPKGILHTIWHHAQCISWVSWSEGSDSCLETGWVLFVRQRAVALCITCFVPIISSFAFLLNCLYLNPQVLHFVFLSSSPSHSGEEKRARSCMVLLASWA